MGGWVSEATWKKIEKRNCGKEGRRSGTSTSSEGSVAVCLCTCVWFVVVSAVICYNCGKAAHVICTCPALKEHVKWEGGYQSVLGKKLRKEIAHVQP